LNENQLIDHWAGSRLVPSISSSSADVDAPIANNRPRNGAGYFYIFGRSMEQFRRDVLSAMNGTSNIPLNLA